MRNKDKKEKKNKLTKVVGYLIGSATLCATAVIVLPEVMPYISGAINKKATKSANRKHKDDDWDPVIEKKKKDNEGE